MPKSLAPINKTPNEFFIIHQRTQALNKPRLLIVVSKKNVKLAVNRNRIKRLIRENFRLQAVKMTGVELVIVVKKKAALASNKELNRCLKELCLSLLLT